LLWHRPSPDRSKRRHRLRWQPSRRPADDISRPGRARAPRRTLNGLNEPPPANGCLALHTRPGAPRPLRSPGSFEVVLSTPFAPPAPAQQQRAAAGVVVGTNQNGNTAIPATGPCSSARGTQVEKAVAEAPVGGTVSVRMLLQPDWTGVLQGIGGGPVVVRNGKVVFRANELFTTRAAASAGSAHGDRPARGREDRDAGRGRAAARVQRWPDELRAGLAMQRLGCVTAPRSTPAARARWRSTAPC
jgi:hypothetical protein